MPSSITCYGWLFRGPAASHVEPRDPSWIELPGQADRAATRILLALHRATTTHAAVYHCEGELAEGGAFACESAQPIFDADASTSLRLFARFCARSVAHLWAPHAIVEKWLATGDERLRAWSHQTAWATSSELTGVARLAARVAMYASHDQQIGPAAREASRLALFAHQHTSREAWTQAYLAQERVLSVAILRGTERAARGIA